MSNNQEIKRGQRWFALTKENGKGTQHQILMIEEDEEIDDNLPEEPVIYTWSDSTDESGMTWRGLESDFRKIFKFIGFNNKNK